MTTGGQKAKNKIDRLYGNLDSIDGKCASLLTFNGLCLAFISIWLGYVPLNWLHFSLDMVFLVFLFSCGVCLLPITIHWVSGKKSDKRKADIKKLRLERKRRTRMYRASWALSGLSLIALVGISGIHTYGTFRIASDDCQERCKEIFAPGGWGLDTPRDDRSLLNKLIGW